MRQVGVTTIARWLTAPLREGVRAYVQSDGSLYRLGSITGDAGRLSVAIWMPYKRNAPLNYCKGQDNYTLQSPVYLYWGKDDLSGLEVDGVELAELGMTTVSGGVGWVGTVAPESAAGEPSEKEVASAMARAASVLMPSQQHCG